MPEFSYKALTNGGRAEAGVVSAPDRAQAVRQLTARGSFVTDLDAAPGSGPGRRSGGDAKRGPFPYSLRGGGFRGGFRGRDRVALLRQLSVGLGAGLPLVTALEVVGEQAERPAVKALVEDLIRRVTAGEALSDAMVANGDAKGGGAFTMMQVSMTRAGETAGALDAIMVSLAEFAERDLELREKLRSAAIYPLMVLGLGLVSILVIMLFILPRIMTVVTETGSALPLPTRILMGITAGLRSPVGIAAALALAAGAFALWRWSRTKDGRLAVDRFKLRLPVVGTAVQRVAVSRFARTLGTLSAANIPIVESMRIVRDTLGNEAMAREIDTVAEGVVKGQAIADELRATGRFPTLLTQVIAMGERTGKLDSLLMSTADSYDKETAAALGRVMTVVPVVFILVLALFVAFILAAALLPIMGMDLAG